MESQQLKNQAKVVLESLGSYLEFKVEGTSKILLGCLEPILILKSNLSARS
jgi:hypothetical protein